MASIEASVVPSSFIKSNKFSLFILTLLLDFAFTLFAAFNSFLALGIVNLSSNTLFIKFVLAFLESTLLFIPFKLNPNTSTNNLFSFKFQNSPIFNKPSSMYLEKDIIP